MGSFLHSQRFAPVRQENIRKKKRDNHDGHEYHRYNDDDNDYDHSSTKSMKLAIVLIIKTTAATTTSVFYLYRLPLQATTCYLLLATFYLLFTACYLLPATWTLLTAACCLPTTAYYHQTIPFNLSYLLTSKHKWPSATAATAATSIIPTAIAMATGKDNLSNCTTSFEKKRRKQRDVHK